MVYLSGCSFLSRVHTHRSLRANGIASNLIRGDGVPNSLGAFLASFSMQDKLLGLLTANPVVALAQVVSELGSWNYAAEMRRTLALAVVMKAAGSREKAWNSNLEGIFELAEVICERYFSTCSNQHTFDCPVEGQAS